MRALYRHGRTAEALDVYHQARTRLADALGLDPGPVLQQLHQAILRGDPLPPTQVSPSPPSMASRVAPAQLPADLATFAGRVEQLNQLDTLLSSSATAVVISAIAGTAGIGKTALAVHWAHRVRDRFPDGQLYANLRGFDPAGPPTPPGGVIRRFLDALGVPIQRIPTDPDTQIDLYRSMLADKRILIVLDNARDPTQVRPLLPGAPGCPILATRHTTPAGRCPPSAATTPPAASTPSSPAPPTPSAVRLTASSDASAYNPAPTSPRPPPPASPASHRNKPTRCSPNSPTRTCSPNPPTAGTPSTTSSATTPTNKPTPAKATPNVTPPSAGSSTTTCTPPTPPTG